MKKYKSFILVIVLSIISLTVFASCSNLRPLSRSNNSQKVKLENKKILFLGDSLTSLENINYAEAIKNPTTPNSKDHYKYIDWIRELTGAKCYNYGYSGSSISRITMPGAPDPASFISRYEDIIKKHSDSSSFDFIIIFGGVNDYMQSAPVSFYDNPDPYSFYGALKKVVRDFQSTYPNAKIILMNPLISSGEGANFDFTPNKDKYVLQDYRNAIQDVARTHGTAHFPTEQLSGLNPTIESISKNFYFGIGDGVHPNPSGHKRIAVPLINFLESFVY